MTPLSEYLREQRARVDEALERFLPRAPACPDVIADAMRYSLFAGGKRFRPILTLAAAEAADATAAAEAIAAAASAEAVDAAAPDSNLRRREPTGAPPDDVVALALPAACAIEMIHTYSLVHDDLPAMDNDTLRRGRPTLHVVHGEGMAILAGDGLLTEAFALLAREPADPEGRLAERIRRTIGVIATAAGAFGMVGGQAIDLLGVGAGSASGRAGSATHQALTHEGLRDMHARKTGALIRASAVSGAIMAGATGAVVAAVAAYAEGLGLAFQIVDDILDVEGATEDLGKTAGKDAAAGKPTYPALFGLDRSRELAREAIASALAALRGGGIGAGRLDDIARWVISRSS